MNRNVRVSLLAIVGAGLALAFIATSLARLYTDWLWFADVGYAQVFVRTWLLRLRTSFAGGILFGALLYLNLRHACRVRAITPEDDEHSMQHILEVESWRPDIFSTATSCAAASLVWLWLFRNWLVVERFVHSTAFGYPDPIFGRDVGFYVFGLPFFTLLYKYLLWLVVLCAACAALVYLITGAIARLRGSLFFSQGAKTHLSVLVAVFWATIAAGMQVSIYRLVYSPRGVVFGASYTDMHADLPALRALTVAALGAGLLTLLTSRKRTARVAIISSVAVLVLTAALRLGYTTLVQQVVVGPNEIAKEREFIAYNIAMTRKAFGLDNVVERAYPATEDLVRQDIEDNWDTISNIRLWDWRPLRQTYSQMQEMRLYYTFSDVDVDRYTIDGRYRQMCIAVREMNVDNLADEARTWVNRHLKFTHGHGVVLSPASEVSPQGLPVFVVRDIPPRSPPGLDVSRPEIYFGELTYQYIIVGTTENEFDYPLGDQNVTTRYEAASGVAVNSLLRRLAFTLRFKNYEILLSRAIISESRIIYNRQIQARVETIAPFLMFDGDPYPVLHQGRVFWIIDAYTYSSEFPYSEPAPGGYNYIKNSVKVVIDAYTGDTTFYSFSADDPVLQVYQSIFPVLFTPYSEMPEGLRQHVRYPTDLFEIQAHMYLTYHMHDPVVFYNKEDLWAVPPAGKEGHEMRTESYYMVMRLPGESDVEYVSLLAFTPHRRQNMIAWLAARSDEPNYGQMILYKFPKESLVFGPRQVDARIDQHPEISERLTLWGQGGSSVIRGNLRVIPVNGSILYVEPLYIQGVANRLPELKRVILAYGDKIVMEETMGRALDALFGQDVSERSAADITNDLRDLAERAHELFWRAKSSSQAGNWGEYGRALDELERVLEQIRERTSAE